MSESEPSNQPAALKIGDDAMFEALRRIGSSLGLPVKRSDVETSAREPSGTSEEVIARFVANATRSGILICETSSMTVDEVRSFIGEGCPVVLLLSPPIVSGSDRPGASDSDPDTIIIVLERLAGRSVDAVQIGAEIKDLVLSKRDLRKLFSSQPLPRKLLCKKELECDSISMSGDDGGDSHNGYGHGHGSGHGHGHGDGHASPLKRFAGLLKLDRADIFTVVMFAFVAGTLS